MNYPGKRIIIFCILGLVYLIHLFVFGDKGILAKNQVKTQLKDLQKELKAANEENRVLMDNLSRISNNPELIIKEAQKLLILENNAYMIRFLNPLSEKDSVHRDQGLGVRFSF